jgi:hypothetical protein
MKSTSKILAILALMLAMFSLPESADAGNVYKFKGRTIHAEFYNVDETGCIFTNAYISASENMSQNKPGAGSSTSGIHVYVSKWNECTYESLVSAEAFAPLPETDYNISGSLRKATLKTTVNVTSTDSEHPESFDVFIDLAWTGSDVVSHQTSNIQTDFHACRTNQRYNNTYHFAKATGTVSDGVTNYAPVVSDFATIGSERDGQISINCDS